MVTRPPPPSPGFRSVHDPSHHLVTGGAGFIGSNIVAKLAEDPTLDLVVCDRLGDAQMGKWRNLSKHPIGDFVGPEDIWDWLEKRWREVEVVIHMGAVSSTSDSDADKVMTTNFGLSRDLYRWCTDHQRRFIYASSAASYGGGAQGFDDVQTWQALSALRPLNVYGWTKALFDVFATRQAARGYAPPQWVGLKFFNVYGPNEEHKGVMRSIASQIWPDVTAGRTVKLFRSYNPDFAHGGQLRDFVYVRDAVDVVAWLVNHERVNGVFNLGSAGRDRSRTWPGPFSRRPGGSPASNISKCRRLCGRDISTSPRRRWSGCAQSGTPPRPPRSKTV